MAYGLPFFLEKLSSVMELAYVCGCKRIMYVVANGLCAWLQMTYGKFFLGKMRPSVAIFCLCVRFTNGLRVWFANGLCVWLQLAYVFCFLLYILCIILPMK